MKCDLCDRRITEPSYPLSDDVVCKCGARYGYANGYRTLMLSEEQLACVKKQHAELEAMQASHDRLRAALLEIEQHTTPLCRTGIALGFAIRDIARAAIIAVPKETP